MSARVQLPAIFRRKLGALRIDAASLGDGRVGFVVEGPRVAVKALAAGLRSARFDVEEYEDEYADEYTPLVIYAESGSREIEVEEEDEVTRRYPAGFTSAMMALGGAV